MCDKCLLFHWSASPFESKMVTSFCHFTGLSPQVRVVVVGESRHPSVCYKSVTSIRFGLVTFIIIVIIIIILRVLLLIRFGLVIIVVTLIFIIHPSDGSVKTVRMCDALCSRN